MEPNLRDAMILVAFTVMALIPDDWRFVKVIFDKQLRPLYASENQITLALSELCFPLLLRC